jgi:hypothetical protein
MSRARAIDMSADPAADWQAALLGLLRPEPPASLDRPSAGPPSADQWQAMMQGCASGLYPWLARGAERRLGPGAVPAPFDALLVRARQGAAVGHLRRQALLRRLLPALDGAGIKALVLKGGALAYLSYPEPTLRTMSDLDLWVQPGELDRAVAVAEGAGLAYSPRMKFRVAASHDPTQAMTRLLEQPQSKLVVEVHGVPGSLADLSPAWRERTWQRAERRALGDVEGWVLHPQDMLTHLALHCGRRDRFAGGLRPLLDLALWLRSDGGRIDWPALLADCEREQVGVWVLLSTRLACASFDVATPPEVAQRVEQWPAFGALLDVAREQAFGAPMTLPPTMARLVASTPRQRAAWIFERLTSWYLAGPPGVRRSPWRVLGDAAGRIGHDLRHKAAPYLRGLVRGHYWGEDFRRRRDLVAGRQRMPLLVEQIEAQQRNPERPVP